MLVSALFMGPFYPTRPTQWVSRAMLSNPSDPFGDEHKRRPDETTPYGVDPLFTYASSRSGPEIGSSGAWASWPAAAVNSDALRICIGCPKLA